MAPLSRASSSSGTSSRANFARPNGNSSTKTTPGRRVRSVRRSSSPRSDHARSTVKRGSWLTKRDCEPTPSGGSATISTPAGGSISSGSEPPHTSTTRNHSASWAQSAYERVRWPRPTECWQ